MMQYVRLMLSSLIDNHLSYLTQSTDVLKYWVSVVILQKLLQGMVTSHLMDNKVPMEARDRAAVAAAVVDMVARDKEEKAMDNKAPMAVRGTEVVAMDNKALMAARDRAAAAVVVEVVVDMVARDKVAAAGAVMEDGVKV